MMQLRLRHQQAGDDRFCLRNAQARAIEPVDQDPALALLRRPGLVAVFHELFQLVSSVVAAFLIQTLSETGEAPSEALCGCRVYTAHSQLLGVCQRPGGPFRLEWN